MVCSKELRLAKQGACELEEEEAKALSTRVVASPNPLVVPLLPLTNPFLFNPSFSLLPNLISYYILKVIFWFLSSFFITCPLDLILYLLVYCLIINDFLNILLVFFLTSIHIYFIY